VKGVQQVTFGIADRLETFGHAGPTAGRELDELKLEVLLPDLALHPTQELEEIIEVLRLGDRRLRHDPRTGGELAPMARQVGRNLAQTVGDPCACVFVGEELDVGRRGKAEHRGNDSTRPDPDLHRAFGRPQLIVGNRAGGHPALFFPRAAQRATPELQRPFGA